MQNLRQPLHKLPIRLPKNIKDRLKKLVSHKTWTTHKLPLAKLGKYRWTLKWRMKDHSKCPQEQSSKINKTSSRTCSIESVGLNLEISNNYNTWNHLTVGQLITSLTFLNINHLHIVHIYLNVCKQMSDVNCYCYIATLEVI